MAETECPNCGEPIDARSVTWPPYAKETYYYPEERTWVIEGGCPHCGAYSEMQR